MSQLLISKHIECFSVESFTPRDGSPSQAEQINRVEEIDGLYSQPLEDVKFFKPHSDRSKDKLDLRLLADFEMTA